jgi:hypothetical protein
MRAEIAVERVDHVALILSPWSRPPRRRTAPEVAQHASSCAPARDVVELLLELGGEVVLDVAVKKLSRTAVHTAGAAVLGNEAALLRPDIAAVLQHLDDRA